MRARELWRDDPIFIEIGVCDARVGLGLAADGYSKYLGVSGDAGRIERLKAVHPEVADQLVCSRREKLVRHNNADVLLLSGARMLFMWKYRSVRHAQCVAWRLGVNLFSLAALVGCLFHMLWKRYTWPRMVTLRGPDGKSCRLLVSRILRHRLCHRDSLHFIPHRLGLTGLFRKFDDQGVRYVVLRWFERLPEIEPAEDVDMLVDDRSLKKALQVLHSQPGIQPCDVYSESGLARSDYCGTPYYPGRVARRILAGAVRHRDLCMVPGPWEYFHSLAYHAVYHKGLRSNLDPDGTGLRPRGTPGHDYAGILAGMADELGIEVDISLEGLRAYLQSNDWGPSPEMLARLSAACWRNRWLRMLVGRLEPHVLDQGLTVFVLREEAVRLGFQDKIVAMIEQAGFEIFATRVLSPDEVEPASARTRGGNWGVGPFDQPGGLPAVTVIAYDRNPLPPNRRQRRKFPQRTNGRIFVKEAIRDAIVAQLPPGRGCNALHSSDHAAEAWHLIEVLAPGMVEPIRARIRELHQQSAATPATFRRAA